MAKSLKRSSSSRINRLIRKKFEEARAKDAQDNVKKTIGLAIIIALLIVSFFLIKPFLTSILASIILAYFFHPLYLKINTKTKKPNLSALIICLGIILILILAVFLTTHYALKELIDFYAYSQSHDIIAPLKVAILKISPAGPSAYQITGLFDNAVEKGRAYMFESASKIIMNIPIILLQLFIIFFVMFYFLVEGNTLVNYSKNLLPFKEKIKKKFLERFKVILHGFIHGTIFVGIIQGLCAGIAFYLLGVSQPFLLTIFTMFAAIIPFVGAWIIWFPVSLNLIIKGSTVAGTILMIYGVVFVSWIDNFLRPIIVGKITKMPNVISLLGMLGGLQIMGIIGLVLGPIILDSVFMVIEIYRSKQSAM